MEELFRFQNNIINNIDIKWSRYLLSKLFDDQRLLGIKGLRGVGKTTLLLQYLKLKYPYPNKALYITADHIYFYSHTLLEVAQEWDQLGGKLLLIDEVHKYPNWSREIKLIYDGFPDLQVFFTSSSALDPYKGESDLSRRLIVQKLHGMSFREFLNFRYQFNFNSYTLDEILENHTFIANEITSAIKVIPLFHSYLKTGYFPFITDDNDPLLEQRVMQIINTTLESDLATIKDHSAANIQKIKRLLGVIAESPPFIPNITKIAEKLSIGRTTVYEYIYQLEDALIIRNLNKKGKGISRLQKPDKIFFENPTLSYAIENQPYIGSIRETFFINQLCNASHKVNLSEKGDFLVDSEFVFEIGGKNKDRKQIADIKKAYLAKDGIEMGFKESIPLWLFGFLY